MKNVLLVLATAIVVLPSCSKKSSSSPSPTPGIPANGWKLGTTSYTTVLSGRSGANTLSAFDAIPSGSSPTVNSFIINFSAFPTAGGTYHIVHYVGGTTLGANEIGVSGAVYATMGDYLSTGNDNVSATVTVTGGKIKVVVPSVWVKNISSSGDSLQLTGTLVEQ